MTGGIRFGIIIAREKCLADKFTVVGKKSPSLTCKWKSSGDLIVKDGGSKAKTYKQFLYFITYFVNLPRNAVSLLKLPVK